MLIWSVILFTAYFNFINVN